MAVVNQVAAQITLQDAGKPVPQASEGKKFTRYFSITLAAGDATSTLRLTKYYKDERLLGGRIKAAIAGATGATIALGSALPGTGVAVSAAKFMAATAIDAALNAEFGHTPALAFGELQTADGELLATIGTAAALVSIVVSGELNVLRNW